MTRCGWLPVAEERATIDEWCRLQAIEDDAKRRRGLEAHGGDVMP